MLNLSASEAVGTLDFAPGAANQLPFMRSNIF